MSDVLDRLRSALPALPDEEPPPSTRARLDALYASAGLVRSRHWWRPTRGAALLAAGAVVVSGTALAATGAWHPQLGSPERGAAPRRAGAPVPADQLAALAILRRPQTAIDRGPLVRAALRVLDRGSFNGIHVDGIRVVFQGPREISVLVPVERAGLLHAPGLPSEVRHDVLCLMSSSRADARTVTVTLHGRRVRQRIPAGLTGWGVTCGTTAALRSTGIHSGTSPDESGGLVVNGQPTEPELRSVVLVPDGVARVRVRLRGGHLLTVPVHDDVYRFVTRGLTPFREVLWYDAAGRRIAHRVAP